jgi:hypothetical protein
MRGVRPNQRAGGDGGTALLRRAGRRWPAAPHHSVSLQGIACRSRRSTMSWLRCTTSSTRTGRQDRGDEAVSLRRERIERWIPGRTDGQGTKGRGVGILGVHCAGPPCLLLLALSDRSPLTKVDVRAGVQAGGLQPQLVTSRMEVDFLPVCSCGIRGVERVRIQSSHAARRA